VARITKSVAKFVHDAASTVEAFFEGRKYVERLPEPPNSGQDDDDRPDFSKKTKNDNLNQLAELVTSHKKELHKHSEEDSAEHKRLQLQIDVLEIIIGSQTIQRYSNNIQLHQANLGIHIHTIKNTKGLVDDVNRLRVAIKRTMSAVNQLIRAQGPHSKIEPIEGIDVEIRQGAISIHDSYQAFEQTKLLLVNEIEGFSKYLDSQFAALNRVRKAAAALPSTPQGLIKWLDEKIEPSLRNTKKGALQIKTELVSIPQISSTLNRQLHDENF
jgi:hypothetical protein